MTFFEKIKNLHLLLIDDDEWIQICLNAKSCSYHLRYKLLQFKTIRNTYYMSVKLNIMHSEM